MKTIARIKWLVLLLLTAGCSDATTPIYDAPGGDIRSISHLKGLCPANGSRTITQNLVIRAIVTANDLHGEYSKSIIVQDAGDGIEISIDLAYLAKPFPIGAVVEVHCNGLAVGEYGGKVLLGAIPAGDYPVDRIPGDEVQRYIRRAKDESLIRKPALMAFGDIGLRHADTYVRFEQVRFAEQQCLWCDLDPETGKPVATRRTLLDAEGRTFSVRTLATCEYATKPVPQGTGSMNGIIDYFNGEFSIRVVNAEFFFPL